MLATRSQTINPVVSSSPAAWYRYGQGITISTGVSQWDDQSGNGNHLKQATGTAQPAKQADGSILFDGASDYLKTDAFTLGIPYSVFVLGKQVTWTNTDIFFDGLTNNSFVILQVGSSPQVKLGDNSLGTSTVSPALDTYVVLSASQDAAKSAALQVNLDAAVTATISGTAMGGFTLGSNAGASALSNIQIKEVILYSRVLSASEKTAVIRYLSSVGGLGL